MDFELKRSASRLRSEQAARGERAQARREEVEKKKAAVRAAREAHEERARERRLKEAAQRENERLQQEEATAAWADGGVALRARLWAVRSDAAQARGIRRHADRAQLPARLGAALQAERLAGSAGGASTWEVRLGGRSAHIAALDFAAEAETVGLPPHVLAQLGLSADAPEQEGGDGGPAEATRLSQVEVSFRKLPKATYAKFRPATSDFSAEVVNVRAVLERALAAHSTLTVGESIGVYVASTDKTYTLEVMEVKPDTATGGGVSVVETDVETDIAPSLEYEHKVERAEFERRQQLERAAREAEEEARRVAEAEAAEAARVEAQAKAFAQARSALAELAAEADMPDVVDAGDQCELMVDVAATGARVQLRAARSAAVADIISRVRSLAASEALKALDSSPDAAVAAAAAVTAPLELVPALPGASPLPVSGTLAQAGVGRRERLIARAAA